MFVRLTIVRVFSLILLGAFGLCSQANDAMAAANEKCVDIGRVTHISASSASVFTLRGATPTPTGPVYLEMSLNSVTARDCFNLAILKRATQKGTGTELPYLRICGYTPGTFGSTTLVSLSSPISCGIDY